jgi:Flp pilus assembly protein TadG
MKAARPPAVRQPPRASGRGGVAVEFALIAPLLMLMFAGIVDLGFAAYESMQVHAAAAAGAQYAVKYGWDTAAIEAAVMSGTGAEGIAASPAPSRFCACPDAGGLAEIDCGDTCPGGVTPGQYGRVNAELEHSTVLSYPGLPDPLTLTGQAIVRLQ